MRREIAFIFVALLIATPCVHATMANDFFTEINSFLHSLGFLGNIPEKNQITSSESIQPEISSQGTPQGKSNFLFYPDVEKKIKLIQKYPWPEEIELTVSGNVLKKSTQVLLVNSQIGQDLQDITPNLLMPSIISGEERGIELRVMKFDEPNKEPFLLFVQADYGKLMESYGWKESDLPKTIESEIELNYPGIFLKNKKTIKLKINMNESGVILFGKKSIASLGDEKENYVAALKAISCLEEKKDFSQIPFSPGKDELTLSFSDEKIFLHAVSCTENSCNFRIVNFMEGKKNLVEIGHFYSINLNEHFVYTFENWAAENYRIRISLKEINNSIETTEVKVDYAIFSGFSDKDLIGSGSKSLSVSFQKPVNNLDVDRHAFNALRECYGSEEANWLNLERLLEFIKYSFLAHESVQGFNDLRDYVYEIAGKKGWSVIEPKSVNPIEIRDEIIEKYNEKPFEYLLIIADEESVPIMDFGTLIKAYRNPNQVLDSAYYGNIDKDAYIELSVGRLPLDPVASHEFISLLTELLAPETPESRFESILAGMDAKHEEFSDLFQRNYSELEFLKKYFEKKPNQKNILNDFSCFVAPDDFYTQAINPKESIQGHQFTGFAFECSDVLNKEAFYHSLANSMLFLFHAHGSSSGVDTYCYDGSYKEDPLSVELFFDLPELENRPIILANSCSTAVGIGRKSIVKGAKNYIGYYYPAAWGRQFNFFSQRNGAIGKRIKDYLNAVYVFRIYRELNKFEFMAFNLILYGDPSNNLDVTGLIDEHKRIQFSMEGKKITARFPALGEEFFEDYEYNNPAFFILGSNIIFDNRAAFIMQDLGKFFAIIKSVECMQSGGKNLSLKVGANTTLTGENYFALDGDEFKEKCKETECVCEIELE